MSEQRSLFPSEGEYDDELAKAEHRARVLFDELQAARDEAARAQALTLELGALLHNIRHLIVRCEAGEAPKRPHEQDRIDAARWLPELYRLLRILPEPERRLIPAGELGGADPVERYYPNPKPCKTTTNHE